MKWFLLLIPASIASLVVSSWVFSPSSDLSADASADPSQVLQLQIPLEQTEEVRAELVAILQADRNYHNRELFETYIDQLGANGMVAALNEAYGDQCHDEAHDFGKILYERTQNVGDSFAACENVCQSGCMHGVTMAFLRSESGTTDEANPTDKFAAEHHVEAEELLRNVALICDEKNLTSDYKLGDCIHGIGHALMFLTDYDVDAAIAACSEMETDVLDYYCATGAYMEYVNNGPTPEDQLAFAPCDTADYPAACFRYKFGQLVYYHYTTGGTFKEFVAQCEALDGKYEIGCFHGIGNGHLQFIVRGELDLGKMCQFGSTEDQYVCIDGLMERLSRYYPDLVNAQCDTVDGWKKELCLESAERELYDLEKPFEYYVK